MNNRKSRFGSNQVFRFLALSLSLTLIIALCAPFDFSASAGQEKGQKQQPKTIAATQGNPLGQNLPDLAQLRERDIVRPQAPAPIAANRPCMDCTGKNNLSDAFALARLEPRNRTGQPDVDLLSQNFRWSKSLVDLKGRAGLDLKMELVYNSLVWTKALSQMAFDADRGQPSPGFRLGFPTIQARFLHAESGKYSYLMITPEGSRVELRQSGEGDVYEATDNSRLQMIDRGANGAVVRRPDGTQLSFKWLGGQLQCTEIKDRNGNYISAAYNERGHLNSVTDTVGHTLTFNRDRGGNLLSITQPREATGEQRTLATFGYSDIALQPNGRGLKIAGTRPSAKNVMLTQVGLADGTRYQFNYSATGQVSRVTFHAPDGHALAYTSYNFAPDVADGSRVTEMRNWAEGANNGEEAVTRYDFDANGAWGQATSPNGSVHKEFFANEGWQRGLTVQTEDWVGGALQSKTATVWSQEDNSLAYRLNPRQVEANIYDSQGKRQRRSMEYGDNGLVSDTYKYGPDGTTLSQRIHFDYNLDSEYVDRHILNLVKERTVYASDGTLLAKTTYLYDVAGHVVDQGSAVQHDGANYGAAFVKGRGLLSAVQSWDVKDSNNASRVSESQKSYNTTGSTVVSRGTSGKETNISYADNFADGKGRNTLAFITEITFSDGKRTNKLYDPTTGATVWGQDKKGTVKTATYDDAGRLVATTNLTTGSSKRIIYDESGTLVATFSKSRANAKELGSYIIYDGARRMRAKAKDPVSKTGSYRGMSIQRDAMGRVIAKTNPTRMSSSWVAAETGSTATSSEKARPLGFVGADVNALGTFFAFFQSSGDYYDDDPNDGGYYGFEGDGFWHFYGDYDGAYNAEMNAVWNEAGGYWNFLDGDQSDVMVNGDGNAPDDANGWWDSFWSILGYGDGVTGEEAGTAASSDGSVIVVGSGGPGADTTNTPGAGGLTNENINIIEQHLNSRFGNIPYNTAMINRLRAALASGCGCIDGPDANFYFHELYENSLMNGGMSYAQAHAAALANYGVTEYDLYHPQVIQAFPQYFNDSWFDYYGLPRPQR
ncbi:MAG TPA: hypothetical protein VF666_16345 [Pyrinomonadaceae bacterium]|jgi:YD repeat-containing protein